MKRHRRGFTLIELMVSIFVLGILTAIAVPSFVSLMNRNRLASQSNELLAAIQYARIEAIRTNAKVTFCGAATSTVSAVSGCTNGTRSYWVVIGKSGGVEQQLRLFAVKDPMTVSTTLQQISFAADGLARDPTTKALVTGAITVCMDTTNPAENKRLLTISSGSKVVITTPAGGSCS
jgi:type IV fimbrial biogenesis protein FimT